MDHDILTLMDALKPATRKLLLDIFTTCSKKTIRGFLFKPPCLVLVGPSIHSITCAFPSVPYVTSKSSILIW